jgi:hypothetical protein
LSPELTNRLVEAALDAMKAVDEGDEYVTESDILNAIFVLTLRTVQTAVKLDPDHRLSCRQACQVLWMETAEPSVH